VTRLRATWVVLLLAAVSGCDSKQQTSVVRTSPYVLVDGEKRAAESPATFEIPPREKRIACKAGDLVKVILEVPPGAPPRSHSGERPWVILKEVRPGPRYLGALDNDPAVFKELKVGDPIEFGPEHIIQIWVDEK
jgi:hypothetical protein